MTTNTNADWKCGNEFLPYHPGASHVEPAYRDGWNDCYRAALTTAAVPPEGRPLASAADRAMRAQAAPAVTDDTHAFQNFHRALCERFGYTHDARDWRRDQASLIEHIAKLAAPAAVAGPSDGMVPPTASASELFDRYPASGKPIDAVRYAKQHGAREVPAYGSRGNPLLLYPDDLARMLSASAAPTTQAAPQPAPVAQGDAEQRAMDTRHAAIYRWIIQHTDEAAGIIDAWREDGEADTDELHDALAARAKSKEGASHG